MSHDSSFYPLKKIMFSQLVQIGNADRSDLKDLLERDLVVVSYKSRDLFVTIPLPVFQDLQSVLELVHELHKVDDIRIKLDKYLRSSRLGMAAKFKDVLEKHSINIREREKEWLLKSLELMNSSLG